MNMTDILTGRIVQRVLDGMNERPNKNLKVTVIHGVDCSHNLSELMNNLWWYFPDSSITFRKLKYGYELRIEVE
jgi:hypothetical protein